MQFLNNLAYPVSTVHDAGDHVSNGLCGVMGHRHSRNLLLDGAVGVDSAAELKWCQLCL
jgi:hypothetical protein